MHIPATPEPNRPWSFGGAKRKHGGTHSRFVGTSHHADRSQAALRANHPALLEGRTLFPSTVVQPQHAPRLLVGGHNSAKIGAVVRKGPWRGMPIFTLTLEERATCPTSCGLLRECFGNAMPLARRHAHGTELVRLLGRELREKQREHQCGFVVRVHVLGDFYSFAYLMAWLGWMHDLPALRVFGYTAHRADTAIGAGVAIINDRFPDRWAFRFSVAPDGRPQPMQATTIWRQAEDTNVPEGLVCPAQTERTLSCGTCGLCWSQAARDKRIVFMGHGLRRRGSAA